MGFTPSRDFGAPPPRENVEFLRMSPRLLLVLLLALPVQDPAESAATFEAEFARVNTSTSLRQLESRISARLAASPDDLALKDVRLRVRERLEDEAGARLDLLDLAVRRPDHPPYRLRKANYLRMEGRYAEARKLLAGLEGPDAARLDAACRYCLNDFDGIAEALDQGAAPWPRTSSLPSAGNARQAAANWKEELELLSKHSSPPPPLAVIETVKGEIEIEMFEDSYPNTVANFVTLAESGFYVGLLFHRRIADFMIQGGCPLGTGQGGAGYRIKDELRGTPRRHFRGSIAMARSLDPNSTGSQFYIAHRPLPWCDGKFLVFGRVIRGMEVVDLLDRGDAIRRIRVTRKRDHPYVVIKD